METKCSNPNCGKTLPRGLYFCAYCGTSVRLPLKSKRRGVVFGVVIALSVVVAYWEQLLPISRMQRYSAISFGATATTSTGSDIQATAEKSTLLDIPSSTEYTAATSTMAASTLPTSYAPTAILVEPTVVSTEEKNLSSLVTASASSVRAPEKTRCCGVVYYEPQNVLDRNSSTSWVEGVPGAGVGQQLVLMFPGAMTVTRIGINIGFDRDESIFFANHRVRRARLQFTDGSTQNIDFEDQRGVQFSMLHNITTTSIVISIESIYQGTKYDDTPISEVEIWGYETP